MKIIPEHQTSFPNLILNFNTDSPVSQLYSRSIYVTSLFKNLGETYFRGMQLWNWIIFLIFKLLSERPFTCIYNHNIFLNCAVNTFLKCNKKISINVSNATWTLLRHLWHKSIDTASRQNDSHLPILSSWFTFNLDFILWYYTTA